MHLNVLGAFIMAIERNYSPTIPNPEVMTTSELRDIKIDEADTNLPLVLTIDYGAIRMPYSQPEESILPINSIVARNPGLIDYVIEQRKVDLIVLNPDSTTKEVGELAKFAPVVVVVDPNGSSVNRVEQMYRDGAVVVLDKSSHPSVLNGAINEVLRRRLAAGEAETVSGLETDNSEETSQEKPVLSIGGLEVNTGKAEIKYNGEVIDLTEIERRILYLLIEKIDTVVSKPAIVESVWEHPIDGHTESSLRVHIHRLRGKIPGFIKTKVNAGYIFMSPKDETPEDETPKENGSKKTRTFHLLSSQTSEDA